MWFPSVTLMLYFRGDVLTGRTHERKYTTPSSSFFPMFLAVHRLSYFIFTPVCTVTERAMSPKTIPLFGPTREGVN